MWTCGCVVYESRHRSELPATVLTNRRGISLKGHTGSPYSGPPAQGQDADRPGQRTAVQRRDLGHRPTAHASGLKSSPGHKRDTGREHFSATYSKDGIFSSKRLSYLTHAGQDTWPLCPWRNLSVFLMPCVGGVLYGLQSARAEAGRLPYRRKRMIYFVGSVGGGAVARVPSLVASCAPLLTPLCASCSSFLSSFRTPASPVLTPLRARLHGIRWRCCGRRGRWSGLGFSLRDREH